MINSAYKNMLNSKSVIRELSELAAVKVKEFGHENVFDYTLGNPSVPCAKEYTDVMIKILKESNPVTVHGYSPSLGITSVRQSVADSLNKRFNMEYTLDHIFMTSGAAGAIAHALRCVIENGEEVVVIAPYFPEYDQYIKGAGGKMKVVPSKEDFQIDFTELEKAITKNVSAIIINSPNNPCGVIYSEESLIKLSDILNKKQIEFGHDIFLISDEPYREIVFNNKKAPYVSSYYDNSFSCYSFSKSLSLPGERIGYLAVNPNCKDSEIISSICGQISRGIGHNCPASIIQLAVSEVLDKTSDLTIYENNMNLIFNELKELGFTLSRPDGTFYIFPKALEEDSVEFCKKALKYNLILVPSDNFGCPGYFRMAFCTSTDKVKRSLVAFREFVSSEYGLAAAS